MPAQAPLLRLRFLALLALGVGSIPTQAKPTTLMFLVDWFTTQAMDTVINLKVSQSSAEIHMVDGSAVPTPQPTTAFTSQKFASWWALPNFEATLYTGSRIRLNTTYGRGWFQNDKTYQMTSDTLLDVSLIRVPDTQQTFTYRMPATATQIAKDTTVALTPGSPRTVALPAGATFRGPSLYSSQGNGGTALINAQKLNSKGTDSTGTGDLDKCIELLGTDTVWIRYLPAGQQQPSQSQMHCSGTNPFHVTTSTSRSWARTRPPSPIQERSGTIVFLPVPGRDVLGKGSAR